MNDDSQIFRNIILSIIKVIIVITLAFLVSYSFLNQRTMQGHSMEEQLKSQDILFLNRLKPKIFSLKRYDIVVMSDKSIKRIVGLPGERVVINNGYIYINDVVLPNLYIGRISNPGIAKNEIYIGRDEYFIIGDNPDSSEDSRVSRIGNVKKKKIEGTIWFRLYPLNRIGIIR
ncbi:MAG: signal peptidase I [Eubacteriales bacterium]|nr:signal peptidase I [Eubacteriales bacterium]